MERSSRLTGPTSPKTQKQPDRATAATRQRHHTSSLQGEQSSKANNNNVRGPQPGFSRRNPTTKASTSTGI